MAREGHSRGIAGRLLRRPRAPLELVLAPAQLRILGLSIGAGLVFSATFWVTKAAIRVVAGEHVGFAASVLHPPIVDLWMHGMLTCAALVFSLMYFRGRAVERRSRVLSGAIEHAPDGIEIVTVDGRLAYSNEAADRMYGIVRGGWRGRSIHERSADPDLLGREVFPALLSRGGWQGEIEVLHADGHAFPVWLTATLIRDERERPLAFVGILRDMTERRTETEALVRYAEELADASELNELFADIMRHDLANPASAIRMSSELLLARELDAQSRRLLGAIHRSAGRVIELCDGAAKYARLTSLGELEFSDLDLAELLRETVREHELPAAEKRLTVTLNAPASCRARASPFLLEVFANLVSNAVKYGPTGSLIEVVVTEEPGSWLIEVRDRGEGVRDADKPRVFSRFERLDKTGVKGTGLGLAIAKRIVDLHGGSICVEDNPGGGAVFKVRLPALASEPRRAAE